MLGRNDAAVEAPDGPVHPTEANVATDEVTVPAAAVNAPLRASIAAPAAITEPSPGPASIIDALISGGSAPYWPGIKTLP
jgi:hypothetical protein